MKRSKPNQEFEFTLLFENGAALADGIEDALYEAGCSDATVALRSGRLVMTFSRAAATIKDAVLSAIRDVRKANIGAKVARIDGYNLDTQDEMEDVAVINSVLDIESRKQSRPELIQEVLQAVGAST